MKRIYIAHPLVGDGSAEWGNRDANLDRYLRLCAYATEQGHVVLSWIHHVLTHGAGLTCRTEDPHDYYLARDERLVEVADELWVCCAPGISRGVDREVACARRLDIPVVRVRVVPLGTYQVPITGEIHLSGEDWPGSTGSSPWPLSIRALVHEAYDTAQAKGWWKDRDRDIHDLLALLALVHSEVSEAVEALRDGMPVDAQHTDANGKPYGVPSELADVLIRIADLCGHYEVDLERAVRRKLAFNRTRPCRHGGKLA